MSRAAERGDERTAATGRRARASPRTLVAEAWANVRAWAVLGVSLAILSAALGAALTWSTADTAQRSVTQISELDTAGRQVLRVTPSGTSGQATVPGTTCEALNALPAVRAAYGIGATDQSRLADGTLVTTQRATAGIAGYLGVPARAETGRSVLAGATVSARNGFVTAGWLAFAASMPPPIGGQVSKVYRLAQTPRTTTLDDSLILPVSADSQVTECRVEPVAGARPYLVTALAGTGPPGVAMTVTALRPDLETNTEPDRRLADLPGSLLTYGFGVFVGLGLLAWWFTRRAEWALYRTFGLRTAGIATIAAVEWLLVGGLPLLIGGLWGIAATKPGSVDLAYRLAGLNLGTAALIAFVAVGAWVAYTKAFSANLALRGM